MTFSHNLKKSATEKHIEQANPDVLYLRKNQKTKIRLRVIPCTLSEQLVKTCLNMIN